MDPSLEKDTPIMLYALVIDGDPNSLRLLAELLDGEGVMTTTASSFEAAQVHLRKACLDVVLIDPLLPDEDGIGLLKDLEGLPTEVILMTSSTSVDTTVEALRLRVSDYLTKPLDIPRLRAVSSAPRRGPFSLTRLPKCPLSCKSSCFEWWKQAPSSASVAIAR
jgi:DNA-binding NtrC family response regulator